MFKRIIVAALMLTLWAGPAYALYDFMPPPPIEVVPQPTRPLGFSTYEALAAWIGCPGVKVVFNLDNPRINASFQFPELWRPGVTVEGAEVHLFGGLIRLLTSEENAMVFMHEIAHCVAWQHAGEWHEGRVWIPRESEWEADSLAVRWAHWLGWNGYELMKSARQKMDAALGRNPDESNWSHGSTNERLHEMRVRNPLTFPHDTRLAI